MRSRGKLDADGLAGLGVAAVEMLEAASKAAGAAAALAGPGGGGSGKAAAAAGGSGGGGGGGGLGAAAGAAAEAALGACLGGGEMPHAQACVAYVLRAAVIRQLPEQAQRRLLERLVAVAAGGIAPPLLVAALDGVGALAEVLGELPLDAAAAAEQAIGPKVSSPSSAVRYAAAAALAALALAAPPLLAGLVGTYLEAVETGAQTLQMLAAPYSRPGAAASSGGGRLAPGTPRAAPDSQTRHAVDALHGAALAVGALLVAGARGALGVPSRLPRSAFWVAKRMVLQPCCTAHWAAAAERDAGYLLLGALCAGGAGADVLVGLSRASRRRGAGGDALELFRVALGDGARAALDEAAYAGRRPGEAEAELAVALWWRASALQALSAYALGVISKGLSPDPQAEVRAAAEMMAPLLEALAARPDAPAAAATAATAGAAAAGGGASSSGGGLYAHPHVAAAAATLELRLLEAFFFLPGAELFAPCHAALLKLCARPLRGAAAGVGARVPPAAAAAVAAASLRHMLCPQDALLGPWLPGRELLEDELAAFAGEPGGPQQHPWEAGLAFTAGFLGQADAPLAAADADEDGGGDAAAAVVAAATSAAPAVAASGLAPTSPLRAPGVRVAAHFASPGPASPGPMAVGGDAPTPRAGPAGSGDAGAGAAAAAAAAERRQRADRVRVHRRFLPFPQPCGLAPALLEVRMWLLGKLLAVAPVGAQLQALQVMTDAVAARSYPAARRDAAQARQRVAASTAVLVAALAGLGPMARRAARARAAGGGGSSSSDDQQRLAAAVLALGAALLEDQPGDVPAIARGAAEVTALGCCIGGAAVALRQVQALCALLPTIAQQDAAAAAGGTTLPPARAAPCLALGAVFRSLGGAPPPQVAADAAAALFAVAARPPARSGALLWALQGLLCVASAAGRAYAPHVRATLRLCRELLVSPAGGPGGAPLLRVAVARLANAMVAVLGRDFALGSPDYGAIRALVTDRGALVDDSAAAAAAGGAGAGVSAAAAAGLGGAAGAEAVWAALEQALFAQQLVLFAPHAVPAAKFAPSLLANLASTRPALRRAAAATLRHLAERDPGALLGRGVEAHLFAALDAESDAAIADQLRASLGALLSAGAPAAPGAWLRLLAGVALAAAPAAGAAAAAAGGPGAAAAAAGATAAAAAGGGGERSLAADRDDDDDDDDGNRRPPPAAAPSPAAAAAAASAASASASGRATPSFAAGPALPPPPPATTPRLRTRLFACDLLLSLFAAVGPDPRHRVPPPKHDDDGGGRGSRALARPSSAAAATDGGDNADWLVAHLQALVDAGFKLATGPAEALRPAGARLLRRAVGFFGGVADPEAPGAALLEQYQAQLVSALRAALAPGAPPALSVAGGALATAFVGAGLAANDGAVTRRLLDLLVAPLAGWRALAFPQYAEAVSVLSRVALLQAHAQCANIASAAAVAAGSGGGGSGSGGNATAAAVGELCASMIVKAQAPHAGMLRVLWVALLQDHAALATQEPAVAGHYRSMLFGDATPALADGTLACYEAAWPDALPAAVAALPPAAAVAAAREAEARAARAPSPAAGAPPSWAEFVDAVAASDGAAASPEAWEEQAAARAWAFFSFLLDDSLALASDHAGQAADAFAAGQPRAAAAAAARAAAALRALGALLARERLEAGLVAPEVSRGAAELLTAVAYDTLYPMAWARAASAAAGPPSRAATPSAGGEAGAAASTADSAAVGALAEAAAGVAEALCRGATAPGTLGELGPALVEALLALTSVAAPFSLTRAAGAGGGGSKAVAAAAVAAARYAPAAAAAAGSSEQQRALDRALAACLAGARALLAQRDPAARALVAPLCEMGVRLLLTAAPGPQLAAAQAFFVEACLPAAAHAADGTAAAACAQLEAAARQAVAAAGSDSARLPAVFSGLLAAAAAAAAVGDDGAADRSDGALACRALGAVQQAINCDGAPAVQRAALEALRSALQDAQQASGAHASKAAYAERLAGALGPGAAAVLHAATLSPSPLASDAVAAAAEALKALLVVNTAAAARGAAAQAAALAVLVPLLAQAAAPPPGAVATPALRDMALRLITAMPGAPAGGAAFRAAVAALPADAKARLQAALQSSAAAAAAAAAAGAGGARAAAAGSTASTAAKPAIQLKTFAALRKPS